MYIEDWNKFIRSEFVTKILLRSIEKLIVFSNEKRELYFHDLEFKNLFYLELHDIRINDRSKFLESNKIETLFLYYRDNLDYFRRDLDDLEKMNKKFGFLKLLSRLKKLKHLNIRNKLTVEFFKNWTQILNKIEQLDVHIRDIKTLLYINNEYPNLKILNVLVFESLDKFASFLSPLILDKLKGKLRKDLKIYLYNIPFERSNIPFICNYLNKSKNQIKLCNSELIYIIDDKCEAIMEEFKDDQHLLDQFYRNVNILVFQSPFFNEQIYRKMLKVEYLNFHFKNDHVYVNFYRYLEIFNNLKEVKLLFDVNQDNANELIALLPIYCWNIFSLRIKCSNQTSFDFSPLLKLKYLKYLKITLINPIDHQLFYELVENLNYLTFFEINFDRDMSYYTESKIRETQDKIRTHLDETLKRKKLAFYVETQDTIDTNTIFYILKKKN